ncbi:hypothetical protein BJ508DRAFT_413648 [Ascobolus immersus RN42]|uniref:Exonuclease domain-containing protein n=1 Tax=Ascobolus immersus RN42 TaxID=1160509 RepID=A0A3N4IB07_ASCIM|nr:hypothetical protein BJ508DRAFT_413648 [Ascobolus immersus RN42]
MAASEPLHHGPNPSALDAGGHRWRTVHAFEAPSILTKIRRLSTCFTPEDLANAGFPQNTSLSSKNKILAPPDPRPAIALSCLLADGDQDEKEVVRLCVVDVLTGDILVDMTPKKSRRRTTNRRKLITSLHKFIDVNTTIIGFGLSAQLQALQLSHPTIVDFQLLYEKGFGTPVDMKEALQSYFKDPVNLPRIVIQNHGPSGTEHDCLENTMGARELVLFWIERNGDVEMLDIEEVCDRIMEIERGHFKDLEESRRSYRPQVGWFPEPWAGSGSDGVRSNAGDCEQMSDVYDDCCPGSPNY